MISVIIPIYNSEKYIKQCIDSILSQTYKNFELLLVDDGSKDSSPKICDEYAAKDKRIVVIHKKNGGVSSARNEGIKTSKGEYITFVDSDDYLDKEFLSKAVESIKNVDMYLSGIVMETFENDKIINTVNYNQSESKTMSIKELFEHLEVTFPQICICGPWCKLYKSETIKNNNILFDETMSLGEDTFFNLNYYQFVKTVYFDQNIYYHYRRENADSLFSKYNPNIYEIHVKVYDKMRELINNKGCSQESITRFENLYTNLLIGCIHHVFKFSKKKEDRKLIINKVMNNRFVMLSEMPKKFKKKFAVSCIKKKKINLLYFALTMNYFNR